MTINQFYVNFILFDKKITTQKLSDQISQNSKVIADSWLKAKSAINLNAFELSHAN